MRTMTIPAVALLSIMFAYCEAAAQNTLRRKYVSPAEIIKTLRLEKANLTLKLSNVRSTSSQQKKRCDELTEQMVASAKAQIALQKNKEIIEADNKTLRTQNANLRKLRKYLDKGIDDDSTRDAVVNLIEDLKISAPLQQENKLLKLQLSRLKRSSEQMGKSLLVARKQLQRQQDIIHDLRQDLAIEKGKRIAPAEIHRPKPKPQSIVTIPDQPKITPAQRPQPVKPSQPLPTNMRILAVSDGFISINAGSTDGVKIGMEMTILRKGNYIATFRATVVDARQTAGNIVEKKLTPKPGDKVILKTK